MKLKSLAVAALLFISLPAFAAVKPIKFSLNNLSGDENVVISIVGNNAKFSGFQLNARQGAVKLSSAGIEHSGKQIRLQTGMSNSGGQQVAINTTISTNSSLIKLQVMSAEGTEITMQTNEGPSIVLRPGTIADVNI